jgi:hypothetical protein
MKKQITVTVIVLAIAVLTMNFHCYKDPVALPFDHQFAAAVDIYPLKKTYALTDTIWIETDLPTKFLNDIQSGQSINADTGKINFTGNFNEFGTGITNPANGFCDIITSNGVNINRDLSQWGTGGGLEYGCGQSNYKCKIGFKPNYTGTYGLFLKQNDFLGSCPAKIKPFYATISYKYKNVDLNMDVFTSLPQNLKGSNNGSFYINKINNREVFIFKVE